MSFHRFVAQFEITLAETSSTSTEAPEPMPQDLADALITEINKVRAKKGTYSYKVEKAKKK
jgi:hypothetical protein